MVITGLTRNQLGSNPTWVRIPPSPPRKKPLLSTKAREVSFVLLKERCLCDIIFKKVVKLLKNICYECYETGCITEKEIYNIAQFVTVKKYNVLYAEELPRFRKQPLKIYALPYDDQPDKTYNGTGRMGLDLGDKQRKKLTDLQKHLSKKFLDDFNFADELMQTESTALQFVSLFEESDNFELIWVRNSGTNHAIPDSYQFIGYDISYPCDYSGSFSIICDCMFICRWHGFDKEGVLFMPEFSKLNDNGLFDDWKSAHDYMVKYLSEEWTERGEYCILEIFKKLDR